jgi:hypothetical protein
MAVRVGVDYVRLKFEHEWQASSFSSTFKVLLRSIGGRLTETGFQFATRLDGQVPVDTAEDLTGLSKLSFAVLDDNALVRKNLERVLLRYVKIFFWGRGYSNNPVLGISLSASVVFCASKI